MVGWSLKEDVMLRLKNSNGDSFDIDLPDDLLITPEIAEKLASGEIDIEADELLRIMFVQALDNLP